MAAWEYTVWHIIYFVIAFLGIFSTFFLHYSKRDFDDTKNDTIYVHQRFPKKSYVYGERQC